jgi:uncharacterized protein with GYD domain
MRSWRRTGGEIKAQYWLVTDGCLFGVTEYPDEWSAFKSSLAIQGRGAFETQIQRAIQSARCTPSQYGSRSLRL